MSTYTNENIDYVYRMKIVTIRTHKIRSSKRHLQRIIIVKGVGVKTRQGTF